jgi:hypothetical protein
MRRMYSEKELTTIINQVVGEYIEADALDKSIADAVDDYLTEHPVDITALEGQDISPATLTSTGDVNVGGDLDVTGSVSGAEIIEKMSGYGYRHEPAIDAKGTYTHVYTGVVKNGNKLTFVNAFKLNLTATDTGTAYCDTFLVPEDIGNKILPAFTTNLVNSRKIAAFASSTDIVEINSYCVKISAISLTFAIDLTGLAAEKDYYIRQELTILLSDDLGA